MISMGVEPDHIELFIPEADDGLAPEISIVVPALNEEITIKEFVEWCWEGLRFAGVAGEIIIVDSSSDQTPVIALKGGARVLRTPKRGLGQAYLDVIPFIRGQFIIMGDCDLTYDFRKVKDFIDSYRSGNDFVMGSRFKGSIEEGAMPSLHRYFGTPLTTWILNKIYHTSYSDIHCGMRGLTKDALNRIQLTSTGWEYASEMVLKAARVGLKIDEVPVTFYKDRDGRFSHHRRAGFWSPWLAGWINLKVMLSFSPDSFFFKPGLLIISLGLVTVAITFFSFGTFIPSTNTLIMGLVCISVGFYCVQIGVISRLLHKYRNGVEVKFIKYLTYNAGILIGAFCSLTGIVINLIYLINFINNNYTITSPVFYPIFGLFLIIYGVQLIGFTLYLELLRRLKI